MQYKIKSFQNNQYHEFETFLKTFEKMNYQSNDIIGDQWWTPMNNLKGFICLAYIENEAIVSQCVITERNIQYQGNTIDCYEIGGVKTLPEHRNKGLFSKLVLKITSIGFDTGINLIYGTPNDRSGPGFRKLNYSFIDSKEQYLILLIRTINPVLRKIGLKAGPILNLYRNNNYKKILKKITIQELTVSEYINATRNFVRMNDVHNLYLEKRLNVDEQKHRRFFYGKYKDNDFYCSTRHHKLDFLQPILVSEYFLNGIKDHSPLMFKFLRMIDKGFYKNTDGVYLRCNVDFRKIFFNKISAHGYILHRKLPICYTFIDYNIDYIHKIMLNFESIYQLTDCDIG